MMFKQNVPGKKTGQYSFLKTVQVQMLNLCPCNLKKGAQPDNTTLDPALSIPFFDAIR